MTQKYDSNKKNFSGKKGKEIMRNCSTGIR
jgi:hypothetical protein